MTSAPDSTIDAYRSELVAYAYRMLASWDDAEDAIQETYLRAWRGRSEFDGRSSDRTWLYRIATNVCLNHARDRARRALPTGLGQAGVGDGTETLPADRWVQPFPGDRDDLRLAFIAGLQVLPASQRAVLLLRDALGYPAAEVADLLGTSVAAVKSRLQRARASIAAASPMPDDVIEPDSPEARRLLDIYVDAFQAGHVDALLAVMRADASLELLPSTTWFAGIGSCEAVLRMAVANPGDWRMEPVDANGQPAVRVFLHGEPYGAAVLDARSDGIAGITVFGDAALVEKFAALP